MKTRRQKEKAERHVRLYHWLVHSPAWRDLTANARAIYVEISSRYGGAGSNNGRIPYSVREAATSLRISKSTASRALIELQEHGFIALMKEGGFNLKARHAAEWRLTEFVSDVDPSAATKEFMRWPPAEIQNTVPLTEPTVPLVKPIGPSGETRKMKNPSHGPSGETVAADKNGSRFRHGYTSSLPGGLLVPEHSLSSAQRRPSPPRHHRGRPATDLRTRARKLFAACSPSTLSISELAAQLDAKQVDVNVVVQTMVAAGEIVRMERAIYAWSVCTLDRGAGMEAYRRGRRLA
jgi:DNA-binding transcriptional ArsR family regulator